jgi:hypothetical protein
MDYHWRKRKTHGPENSGAGRRTGESNCGSRSRRKRAFAHASISIKGGGNFFDSNFSFQTER